MDLNKWITNVKEGQHLSEYELQYQTVDPGHVSNASIPWNTQGGNHDLRENGLFSNSVNNHDQQAAPTSGTIQDGAFINSISTSGATGISQGSSGYNTYLNTDPYGYSSAGYASYYNQYQQQPNQYPQPSNQYQQPSNQYQPSSNQYRQPSNQYQPPSNQYQPSSNQYQPPPNQYQPPPNQYQEPSHQYQQPSTESFPHHVGAYQNTGAPYQPLSSFQNTGSFVAPTSYTSTYLDPGAYQTSGSYTSSTYGTQTNSWHGGQHATYSSHQYSHYPPLSDSNSSYSSTYVAGSSQYEQHYNKQWEDYYNQREVSCAPGTENISVPGASGVACSVPSGSSGHAVSNNQIPAAYTSSQVPAFSSSELTFMQPVTVSRSISDTYWKQGSSVFQSELPNTVQPHTPKPPDEVSLNGSFQNQQNSTFTHMALYPASYQVSQSHQSSIQTVSQPTEHQDSRKASKLQIPTNPSLPFGQPKTARDTSVTSTAVKSAYISISLQTPNAKVVSHDEGDSIFKHGTFHKSLSGYVERVLARCKDDRQKEACQDIMKEVIKKATGDGTLFTRDWDIEPLFPLPNIGAVNKDDIEFPKPTSTIPKNRSPGRRAKSRWEPVPDEREKSANNSNGTAKYNRLNKQFLVGKSDNSFGTKYSSPDQRSFNKNVSRPAKRQRLGSDLNEADDGEASIDSDKEHSLTKYYSAATTITDSPEEKRRRENRSKRFDMGHGNRAKNNNLKEKDVGAGNSYARKASASLLSRNFESGIRAVEDIDWDALIVKGTCQEIEKRYLRLTSAPDSSSVRPDEILEKALVMVQNSQKNYLYKCDQLKSIRQDLTVQHIRNELTVKVYETHARLAIEAGDLPEYNQCQSQLTTLYAEGIGGCHMEFAAYNLLCVILHSNNNRDLLSSMSRLSVDSKKDEAVMHALSVRAAVTSGNYVTFFRLYKTAPNLNTFLMDLYVEKMRYTALKCISRSHRPTIPVSYLSQILGFASGLATLEPSDEKETDGAEECKDWLKAHGACFTSDNSGEILFDAKASLSSLYMPEPDDAVAHGDVNLAVNDFFTRSLL